MSKREIARFVVGCLFVGVVIGAILAGNYQAAAAMGIGVIVAVIEILLRDSQK